MSIVAETYIDSVTITHRGTRNADNSYDYDGIPVGATGRVVWEYGVRQAGARSEFTYPIKVYFPIPTPVAIRDKLTIGGLVFYVKEIAEHKDVTGTLDHYEVFCGWN